MTIESDFYACADSLEQSARRPAELRKAAPHVALCLAFAELRLDVNILRIS